MYSMIYLVVINLYSTITISQCQGTINMTDLRKCKLTHKGLEYTGPVSKTAGGIRCQFWETTNPIHKPAEGIEDTNFPDGTKKAARNFCRNPTGQEDGPWCYSMDANLREDFCDVPLCIFTECRLSGPGVEYGGKVKKAGSDVECEDWDDEDRPVLFPNTKFPDESRRYARSRCRNPDGDPGGPWCFIENEDTEKEEKNYCDIPFCDDQDCVMYSTVNGEPVVHNLFTSLNTSLNNLTIGLKLWEPSMWSGAKVYLALSAIASPATGEQLSKWGAGIEITIGNTVSGLSAGSKDKDDDVELTPTPGIISGSKWSWFWLSWGGGFITLGKEGTIKPITIDEYVEENNILGLNPGSFQYYSIAGTGVLWSLPFCEKVTDCEVETTTQVDFPRLWPMKRSPTGYDVPVFVRATQSAFVELRPAPSISYPNIKVMIGVGNVTRVVFQSTKGAKKTTIAEVNTPQILSYWNWREFLVSTLGDHLFLYWTKDIGTQTVLEVKHSAIRSARWFGLASWDTTAHWTMFCRPDEGHQPPEAMTPECAISQAEVGYHGTQWVTDTGRACIPWTDERIPENLREDKLYIDRSRVNTRNYCRNLDHDPQGPFCYVVVNNEVHRQYCRPRKCRTSECRMAGTGNDYIGKLNNTRSNRTCQAWNTNSPHKVNELYLNETLYPENSVTEAKNYCRDPSRNIAGPWCYTTDSAAVLDLCHVPDCVKPEECTVLTRGSGTGRPIYILPQWRKTGLHFWLKEWDPDHSDGIVFILRPLEGVHYYKLTIGAENNEKVLFTYGDGKDENLLKEKALPHLIPIGKWGGFWLKILHGEVLLGYEGVDNPLFQWTSTKPEENFKPMLLTYTSLIGYTIGVSFKCDECHTENTSTNLYTKILPIGLWSKEPGSSHYNNLTLYIKGTGLVLVPLITQIGTADYYALVIKNETRIFFTKQLAGVGTGITGTITPWPLIEENNWTVFFILGYELIIARNDIVILQYQHTSPLLFYYFTVGAEDGYIIWSANCKPPDLELPARDGGWTEWTDWTCSVTCGGGVGIQTRTCTNPTPNVYGDMCNGSDTMKGKCNTFPCGEISPDTEEIIKHRLQTKYFSKEVDEGDIVKLDCDRVTLAIIKRESPKARVSWLKDGNYLKQISKRIQLTKESVVIKNSTPSDSGVYLCVLHRVMGLKSTLRVVTLAVKPRWYTRANRETRAQTLWCNSLALGYIYDDLSQRWEHNGIVWKDYGITTPAAVNELLIRHLNKSQDGEWKCIVTQKELNFKWTTNWIKLQVKDGPTFLTYLMEDPLPSKLFKHFKNEQYVLAFLIGTLVLTVLIVALGTFIYIKFLRLP